MFIQSQDDSQCCYSLFIKVVILMIKLKYSICCGLDVHKNVIVATIVLPIKTEYLNISKNPFQLSIRIFKGFTTGLSRIIAIMFVWNPPESIGFLFLIISKMTLMSALHIRSMSKPLKARKRTKRILNGLPTSTNLILSDVPLFLQKIFVSLGNFPDTVSSWSA